VSDRNTDENGRGFDPAFTWGCAADPEKQRVDIEVLQCA
jgi:hypothetical protein